MYSRMKTLSFLFPYSVITITIIINIISRIHVQASKPYSGHQTFIDVPIIDYADPAKHGFHIILDQHFVQTYLLPIRFPTVFASAIPLKKSSSHNNSPPPRQLHRRHENSSSYTNPSIKSTKRMFEQRITKILDPEKGNPEDGGLLDGRTIKLLGLRERSWYYVCVEFESNTKRDESSTGLSCQLRRTLDKFGKNVDSMINRLEVIEITDRSISVHLHVDVDFPVRLTVYLHPDDEENSPELQRSIPAQTFVVNAPKTLRVDFGPFLEPDTAYGRVCVLEEPLTSSIDDSYTAMGRYVSGHLEHCYLQNLKTKKSSPHDRYQQQQLRQQQLRTIASISGSADQSMQETPIRRAVGMGSNASRSILNYFSLFLIISMIIISGLFS